MSSNQRRILIALYNMGGPSQSSDVRPFLHALFRDNDLLGVPFPGLLQEFVANKIVNRRGAEVEDRYQQIGGGSPQLKITEEVCQKIRLQLEHHSPTRTPAFQFVGVMPLMRYTAPNAKRLLQQAAQLKADEIWLYAQYPHCSRATTGSSLRDLGLALASENTPPTLRTFLPTAFQPAFVELWVRRLKSAWENLLSDKKHILVSAHSLPVSYIAQGDPYAEQILRFALEVLRRLGLSQDIDWSMCWQSAVGPAKWLRPYTPDALKDLRQRGVEDVLVWPISFVDHIETLYELDCEYGALATKLGFKSYQRIRNLNADDDYIQFSTAMILEAAETLQNKKQTHLLRCLKNAPSGEGCQLQPGGCLCARYFHAGLNKQPTGVPWSVS